MARHLFRSGAESVARLLVDHGAALFQLLAALAVREGLLIEVGLEDGLTAHRRWLDLRVLV